MNNPSPLIPQGSLLEQKNKSRSKVKVAFFCVVGVHVVAILVALLAQGCKREQPQPPVDQTPAPATNNEAYLPVLDTATNQPAAAAAPAATNQQAQNTPPYQPPQPEQTPPPAATAAQEYVIKKGDTFATIAPRFHVTVKAIQAANPTVNASKLQINQKIVIPAPTTPAATPAASGASPTTTPAETGHKTYVVKGGDNLTKIAKDFHTTPAALRKANSLKTDKIKVGDKLKVPVKAAPAAPAEPAPSPATAAPTSTPPAATNPAAPQR